MKPTTVISLIVAFFWVVGFLGCGNESRGPNLPPETSIVSGPTPGSAHSYRVGLTWSGSDPDGYVTGFEIAWVPTGSGVNPNWIFKRVTTDTFELNLFGKTEYPYTFLVRAVDNDDERDSTPATLAFVATTKPPRSVITYPTRAQGQRDVWQGTCVTVRWKGTDEDGRVVAYRYAWKLYDDWPASRPPPDGDTRWSDWTSDTSAVQWVHAPDPERPYSFYVQAKDNAGAIETTFVDARNHIRIFTDQSEGNKPWIEITCYRGTCTGKVGSPIASRSTFNPGQMGVPVNIEVGDTVCFVARFGPGRYATRVTGIQFAQNSDAEPSFWLDASVPGTSCYPSDRVFVVSEFLNTIHVWVKDDYCEYGEIQHAYIRINGVTNR